MTQSKYPNVKFKLLFLKVKKNVFKVESKSYC